MVANDPTTSCRGSIFGATNGGGAGSASVAFGYFSVDASLVSSASGARGGMTSAKRASIILGPRCGKTIKNSQRPTTPIHFHVIFHMMLPSHRKCIHWKGRKG